MHGKDNATNVLAIVSAPLFFIALISLGIDKLKYPRH